jgi:hypothetical protein
VIKGPEYRGRKGSNVGFSDIRFVVGLFKNFEMGYIASSVMR